MAQPNHQNKVQSKPSDTKTIRTRFRTNIRHKKPSEQGSGLTRKTQNKVQDLNHQR
nr:hypothetical protein [Mycoplasmopsis bovis]